MDQNGFHQHMGLLALKLKLGLNNMAQRDFRHQGFKMVFWE